MVLTYLGTIDLVYSSARFQIMKISIVSSLLETYHFSKNVVHTITWHYYNNLRSIYLRSSGEADWEMRGSHWWPRWYRGGRGGPWGGRGDDSVIYCYYCKESGHTKYQSTLLKGKPARCTYLCYFFRWAVAIWVWAIPVISWAIEHTSPVFIFLCHSSSKSYSYILSYIVSVTCLDYRFRSNWSHDWEWGIMSSFTFASDSIVLADGSQTPI